MIVVDASVAVKWFLPEQGSDKAIALLSAGDALLAPDLIRVEVAAAVTRRARQGDISQADAKETVRLWLDSLAAGVLQLHTTLDDLREAGNLSLQLSHPFQDCLYLALARRTSSRFVTADRKFAERALTVFTAVESLYQ